MCGALVTGMLAELFEPDQKGRRRPESLYGAVKAWEHLRRRGVVVARCTVARLVRGRGWRGNTRARSTRTTVPDPGAARSPDLVRRNFRAGRPGRLHVADFTYVPLDGSCDLSNSFPVDQGGPSCRTTSYTQPDAHSSSSTTRHGTTDGVCRVIG